jgi:hypothetical protein
MSKEAELAALSFVWAKVLADGETVVDAPPGPISSMLDRVHHAFLGDSHALETLERARRDGTQDSVDALAAHLARYAARDRKLAAYMLDFRGLLDPGNEFRYTGPGTQDVKTARDAFAAGGRRPGRESPARRNTGASRAPGAEPGERPPIHYREDRSSAKRPSVTIAEWLGTGLGVALAVLGRFVVDDGRFFFRFLIPAWSIGLIFALTGLGNVDGRGYTGIQVTPEGVAIGGIRFAERRSLKARRRRAVVPLQHSQVFSCPWHGIREIYVEEDRRRLRKAARRARYGHGPTELGNLSVRWMRAALVVRVDLRVAALPEIRRTGYSVWSEILFDEEPSSILHNILFHRQTGRGFHQELWIAPTRRPAELRRVLAKAGEAGLLRPDPQ